MFPIRNKSIKLKIVDPSRMITKFDYLVVTIRKMASHSTTSFRENPILCTARSITPSSPRIAKGLCNLSACWAVVKIKVQLCECIATSNSNYRNE